MYPYILELLLNETLNERNGYKNVLLTSIFACLHLKARGILIANKYSCNN